jgi:chemotaxis protein MotA
VDLATVIGIVTGLGLVVTTIIMGGSPEIFIHVPSMMIVFGGATGAVLISFQLKEVLGVIGVIRKAFFSEQVDNAALIQQIVQLSQKARKEGLLAIDKEINQIEDAFLRSGMEMVVDGTEAELIRNIMETELSYTMSRHKRGQLILTSYGEYAPAFGMIGTLIGLIAMLQNLSDPSQIGGGMAVALITTFYGAFAANLVFLPLAKKLKNRSEEEIVTKEMIIEGVLSIQFGEHPNTIQRKLMNFLSPKERVTE